MRMRYEGFLLASLILFAIHSVSQGAEPVSLDQVPAAVRASITRELGEKPSIESIERKTSSGQMVYEVEAEKAGGFDVDLRIAEDGTVLKKQDEISPSELPETIRTQSAEILGKLPIHQAKRVSRGDEMRYEVEAESSTGDIEIEFRSAGTLYSVTRELAPATLPKPILESARVHLGGVAISSAEHVTKKGKATYKLVGYPAGKEVELAIAEDGTLLEKETK